jgi:hypothetical protein
MGCFSGWWLSSTPLKNTKVSWDDSSQYMDKNMFQTTNQLCAFWKKQLGGFEDWDPNLGEDTWLFAITFSSEVHHLRIKSIHRWVVRRYQTTTNLLVHWYPRDWGVPTCSPHRFPSHGGFSIFHRLRKSSICFVEVPTDFPMIFTLFSWLMVEPPLWQIWVCQCLSVGMMKFPIWLESHKIHVPSHQPAMWVYSLQAISIGYISIYFPTKNTISQYTLW